MTAPEKHSLIDRFEGAYAPIERLVAELPDEAFHYVPEVKDAWSINDHLVHLLDAEVAGYFRVRNAMASPGLPVQTWDEEAWQAKLAYGATDGRVCLALAMQLRSLLCASLRSAADRDWSALWLEHPEKGRLDLPRLLEIYRDHLAYHAPFIKRNIDAWKFGSGKGKA